MDTRLFAEPEGRNDKLKPSTLTRTRSDTRMTSATDNGVRFIHLLVSGARGGIDTFADGVGVDAGIAGSFSDDVEEVEWVGCVEGTGFFIDGVNWAKDEGDEEARGAEEDEEDEGAIGG